MNHQYSTLREAIKDVNASIKEDYVTKKKLEASTDTLQAFIKGKLESSDEKITTLE